MYTRTTLLLTLLALAIGLSTEARAQHDKSSVSYHQELGRAYLERILYQNIEDGLLTEEDMRTMLERYDECIFAPLDANEISFDDLLTLPLMTEYKAYQFVRFRTTQGGHFSSPSQLKLIVGWEREDVDLYYPMLILTPPRDYDLKLRDYWERGHSQIDLIAVRPMRTSDTDDYLGGPLALGIRWRWRSAERLSIMLGAERDSYEPWRHEGHWGLDSYTGHIAFKGKGALSKLILGDYRVRWGEGLLLGQGWRTSSPLMIGQTSSAGITPISGTSEVNKSRGIASELKFGRWRLSAVASYRLIDGYVSAKTLLATGLSDIGLHRTDREWYGRHNIAERYAGTQLAYRPIQQLEIALSALAHDWDGTTLANAPGASGVESLSPMKRHSHLSLSYRYGGYRGRWALSGEIARSSGKDWAGVQRISYRHGRYGRATLGMRYIGQDYWSYYGRSYTHYLRPHNEVGASLGIEMPNLLPRLAISIEGDYYRSLRPRWRQREISHGHWIRSQLRYRLGATGKRDYLSLQGYYRGDQSGKRLWRYNLAYTGSWGGLSVMPKLSLAWHTSPKEQSPLGYSLGMKIDYTPPSSPLHLRASGTYYHVPDWDDRLYLTEAKLHEWYSSTFLYGRGYRLSAVAERRLLPHLSLGLQVVYHYRHAPHSSQTYMALQLRYR